MNCAALTLAYHGSVFSIPFMVNRCWHAHDRAWPFQLTLRVIAKIIIA
jgi:hypothetical protein